MQLKENDRKQYIFSPDLGPVVSTPTLLKPEDDQLNQWDYPKLKKKRNLFNMEDW